MTQIKRWFIIGASGEKLDCTEAESKERATELLAERMLQVTGMRRDWSFWSKKGFKVRRK